MYSFGHVTRLSGLLLPRVHIARSVPTSARVPPMPVHAALSRCTSRDACEIAHSRRCIHEQFDTRVFIE